MEKPAPVDHPVHPLIEQRWSPRAFSDRAVPPETLRSLFEAARWSASCFNEQPWRFLVATREQPEEHARLVSCLVEGNRSWAGAAPVLLLTAARERFSHNDKDNRHGWHDVGLAMAQLTLQAASHGIFVHQMAGIQRDRCREVWQLPDGYEVITGAAVGYPGDPDDLPEKMRQSELAERNRRPLSELVMAGGWGQPAPWLTD